MQDQETGFHSGGGKGSSTDKHSSHIFHLRTGKHKELQKGNIRTGSASLPKTSKKSKKQIEPFLINITETVIFTYHKQITTSWSTETISLLPNGLGKLSRTGVKPIKWGKPVFLPQFQNEWKTMQACQSSTTFSNSARMQDQKQVMRGYINPKTNKPTPNFPVFLWCLCALQLNFRSIARSISSYFSTLPGGLILFWNAMLKFNTEIKTHIWCRGKY